MLEASPTICRATPAYLLTVEVTSVATLPTLDSAEPRSEDAGGGGLPAASVTFWPVAVAVQQILHVPGHNEAESNFDDAPALAAVGALVFEEHALKCCPRSDGPRFLARIARRL